MQKEQPQQLQLPYMEVGKVLSRDSIRKDKETFTQTARASFTMPLNKIKERDGFNSRIKYEEIQELAEDIFNRGQDEPMVLDITPEGGLIDCGHRRYRAFLLNVELGRMQPDVLVEFYPNKASVTELDRMVRQITSNVNLKKDLKVYEKAKVAWNVKNLYTEKPLSHEEVAKLLHLSRQTVDNLIKISEADDALKNTMVEKDLNLKDCLALVKTEKDLKKQTDKVEEASHKNTAPPTPLPKDMLSGELKELEELEKETDEERDLRLLREKTKADQAHEQLMEVSDEIKVKKIGEHIGRKLSAPALMKYTENIVDDEGETVTVDREKIVLPKGEVITEETVELLKNWKETGIDTIFVYKKGCEPVAASVITEPVAQKEKSKYDESRPEVAQVQNIIKIADKIEAVVNKLDCPDQTKLDLGNYVKWLQKDAAELRDWVHTNKKQNKMR